MTHSDDRFHLILARDQAIEAARLAKRLAPVVGEAPHDLALRLRYSGGWIAEDVTAAVAGAMEAILRESGVEHRRIPARAAGDAAPPARPVIVSVRTARIEGATLCVDAALCLDEIPVADVRMLDFAVFGTLETAAEASEKDPLLLEARRLVEALPSPYARQRLALLDHRRTLRPLVHLLVDAPQRFLRIERGTQLPGHEVDAGYPWLERLLGFLDDLILELPPHRVSGRAREFWSEGRLESILIHKTEELENRLRWLALLAESEHTP